MISDAFSLVFLVTSLLGFSKISWMLSRGCMPGWDQKFLIPFFMPPKWVFMVVWPALYVLLAVAAWTVWRQRDRANINMAMFIFVLHMALNFAWSPVSFCSQNLLVSFGLLVVIMVFAYINLWFFYQVDSSAAQLMWPYLLWLWFALLLSFSFVVINYPTPVFNHLAKILVQQQ